MLFLYYVSSIFFVFCPPVYILGFCNLFSSIFVVSVLLSVCIICICICFLYFLSLLFLFSCHYSLYMYSEYFNFISVFLSLHLYYVSLICVVSVLLSLFSVSVFCTYLLFLLMLSSPVSILFKCILYFLYLFFLSFCLYSLFL